MCCFCLFCIDNAKKGHAESSIRDRACCTSSGQGEDEVGVALVPEGGLWVWLQYQALLSGAEWGRLMWVKEAEVGVASMPVYVAM